MRISKRLLIAAALVALFASDVYVIGRNMRGTPTANVPPGRTVTSHSVSPLAPRERVPKKPVSGNVQSKPKTMDAVSAAALAMSNLSQAQLLPTDEMKRVITATVVPSERRSLLKAYKLAGPDFAKFLGYSSAGDAGQLAAYYVSVQKYRVGLFRPPNATIWLYTVSHWITVQNLEYYIPSLTVVRMKLVKSQWLYVNAHDPPAASVPAPLDNLSYDQTVRRFRPFLKGFHPYEGS